MHWDLYLNVNSRKIYGELVQWEIQATTAWCCFPLVSLSVQLLLDMWWKVDIYLKDKQI